MAEEINHIPAHGHGRWLYACGHTAYTCRCPHAAAEPHYLTDLCAACRARILPTPLQTERPQEPFPKARD